MTATRTPPTVRIPQRQLHEQLITRARRSRERITALARPLDTGRLLQRPAPDSWSAGELLEHLCLSDEVYAEGRRSLVGRGRTDAGAPLREWRPTLLGALMAWSLESPRPLKAPKAFTPGPSPRNGVVEAYLAIDSAVTRQMDDAAALDWRALRMAPPSLPPVVRLNLGDVYRISVIHVERHAAQLERIIAKL
ncbi:MAG: DinB family protein [Gemmatimonadaceae bacterium]|nr:DinB family protein [Gemmatimonadaceae bacterium]